MNAQSQFNSLKEDFISRLSDKKKHTIALVILFILPLILYSPVFFGGKHFMSNDLTQWRAGSESVIEFIKKYDEHPNWATNMFSGMPSYVLHNPSPPPSVDTFIKKISGSMHPLPYFWILLGGGYLFFVIQGVRPFSSALGSILIGFTTYLPIIIEAGHNNKFVAFAFIPWLFIGYHMISRSDKKLLAFFTFALAVTLQLRANHPQVTYYFLYLLGFWWMYDTWLMYKKDQLMDWAQRTGVAFGAGFLGILCSIDMYWRLYEYAQYSTRGGSTLSSGAEGTGLTLQYAFSWSQGIGELLTLIIPGIYGGASSDAYWGPKSFTSGPHYFGAIAFILALVGLIKYRKRLKYLFFGVGSLTMLFSLGYHFPTLNEFMFNYMPYFNKFRTPEMWLIVTVFCYSVLAVYGVEAIIDIARDKKASLKDLYLPIGLAVGIGVLFAFGSDALLSYEKPGEFQQYAQQLAQRNNVSPDDPRIQQGVKNFLNNQVKPKRKEMASSDSMRYLILVLLTGGLIVGLLKRKISKGYFLIGLVLLTAYDMLSVDSRYVEKASLVSKQIDIEQTIQRQQKPVDKFVMKNVDSGKGYEYRVFPLSRNPFNNAVPSYFYPTIGGYTGAKLAVYQDMVDHLLMNGNRGFNDPILDMLNVKYVTTQQSLPFSGYTEVFNQNGFRAYRNDDVLPKAFLIDSVRTVDSPQQAVDLMKPNQGFNPAQTAIVETGETFELAEDTTAEVSVTSYNAKTIELKASASKDQFLVLSEVYYPAGWHATIDGEPAKIYKTNFVLRGLQVPAGEHTITMTFEPASAIWGLRLAWIGHIILWITGIRVVAMRWKGLKGV